MATGFLAALAFAACAAADAAHYDVVIAGGKAFNPFYCASFGIDESILYNVGLPRMDSLRENRKQCRELFDKTYPWLRGKKIILYAPTFRKGHILDASAMRDAFDFRDDQIFVVKRHPNQQLRLASIRPALTCSKLPTSVILTLCDCVITDYSAITIEAAEPVAISGGSNRNYLFASIIPTTFADGESMSVKLYTETKVAKAEIPLQSRTFAAGHSTPVRIIPESVQNRGKIYVNILSNNLGENVDKVTFSAPAGCKWSDNGTNTYVYEPSDPIADTRSFVLEYEDEAAFRTMSGQAVTVTYDSEHVTISESLTVEDLAGKYSTVLNLNVPYLLYEDFSGVESFSSNDVHKTSSAGSKDAVGFLDGWSGGRIGAEAGKCIRIACRRETSVDYHARVDSAPLKGIIKKPADISVEFDYGADNQPGGIPIAIYDGNVGQDCYIGYTTTTKQYKSGATDGTFDRDVNTFYIKEYTGSYSNTPNNDTFVLQNVPAGDLHRISWRTEVEHQAGTTNTTAWLYIDNVKVKISSK